MVDIAHPARTNGHIASILLIVIKAAFLSVAKGMLVYLINVMSMDGNHI
jgi:hypothetical protein